MTASDEGSGNWRPGGASRRFGFRVLLVLSMVLGLGWLVQEWPEVRVPPAVPSATPVPPGGEGDRRPAELSADPVTREIHARFRQGAAMLHGGQYEMALPAFHRVLELAPEMPEAHVNMGFALIGLQRFAAARDFFQGALSLRPSQANAYYGLALAMEELGDLPLAVGAMRSYIHLTREEDPYLPKARAALWEWESRIQEKPVLEPLRKYETTE